MSVLLFFIDGIGIGKYDPEVNPFAKFTTSFFPQFLDRKIAEIPFDGVCTATDVRMGLPGLPQSATGQTAMLTGKNASRLIGRHHPGFPTVNLRKLLAEESIFLKIEKMRLTGTFANAFTPAYFRRAERSISASTWSLKASTFPFRWLKPDLWENRAISHDLTNDFLNNLGHKAPSRTPEEAAEILATITRDVDFCLFEYFLTDAIGHGQDMDWAKEELGKLKRFLQALLTALPLQEHTVILTSDHGNFEDLSVPTHTSNAVPTIVWGKNRNSILKKMSRIENVTGTILEYLSTNHKI